MAFVVPMKDKKEHTILQSVKSVLEKVSPSVINTDNGSEWISHGFQQLMKNRGIVINYVDVGDHHKMGICDRFVRTLREKMNKYMAMYNTTKYINVLPQIVHGYKNTYHSVIKKIPNQVKNKDEEVTELIRRKYKIAKQEEVTFKIGDEVRYILNKKLFDKGTLPKWSKMVHKIVSNTAHTYTLDNGIICKYYELELVNNSEHITRKAQEPTREQMRKERSVKRKIRQEGISMDNIINHPRAR